MYEFFEMFLHDRQYFLNVVASIVLISLVLVFCWALIKTN